MHTESETTARVQRPTASHSLHNAAASEKSRCSAAVDGYNRGQIPRASSSKNKHKTRPDALYCSHGHPPPQRAPTGHTAQVLVTYTVIATQ